MTIGLRDARTPDQRALSTVVNRHTGAVPDQYPSPTTNYFNVLGREVHKIRAVVDHRPDGQDDRDLAADLIALPGRRAKRTAAALVDLAASPKIKFACIDADPETLFEVGSITKGLTGMLLADAIDRGEVSLDTTIGDLLPGDEGTEFGSISLKELCTHTSGLPRMPRGLFTFLRGARFLLLGTHPYRGMTASGVLRAAARQRRTLMSSKTTAASIESDSSLVTPPANAKTVIPAANPPAIPETLSSTTAHRSGDVPICSAANRKMSGAGFPCSTWSTLNMQPSKRSRSPVMPNVKRIFSWLPLDATQTGMLISSSA